jgi:hypothetical protein
LQYPSFPVIRPQRIEVIRFCFRASFRSEKLKESKQEHLGVLINRILNDVIRPFLEKWNGPFRAWWVTVKDGRGSRYEIQNQFPSLKDFTTDWRDLRRVMRKVEETLRDEYQLIPLK